MGQRCGTFETFIEVWHFRDLHRGQRKLGDIPGDLCGTFETFIEVSGSLGDIPGQLWRRGVLRDRRGTFGTSGSICVT
eukprot:symbB.v1.2.041672.t1/scaffold8477.1/size6184/1